MYKQKQKRDIFYLFDALVAKGEVDSQGSVQVSVLHQGLGMTKHQNIHLTKPSN